jgi:hypothetical protein
MSSVSSTFRAGGGFVQQQQLGFGAQRSGHFHHLAHAIGQAGNERVPVMLQVEEVDDLLRLFAGLKLGRPRGGREEQFAPETGLAVGVPPDQQVVQHRGVLEQLDVLEGARNAERSNRVGGAVR